MIRVGVAILLFDTNRILLGKRKGPHGSGTWAPPGGHLEFRETPLECAKRELLEETGIQITSLEKGPFVNDFIGEKHYVTLYFKADHPGDHPKILEPEKCECWQWFNWGEFPEPLFTSFKNFISEYPTSL